MANDPLWMEHAAEKMKKKGTVGSFGKATPKKIAAAKAHGGKQAQKGRMAEQFAKAARH